jgi:hypothetical protein
MNFQNSSTQTGVIFGWFGLVGVGLGISETIYKRKQIRYFKWMPDTRMIPKKGSNSMMVTMTRREDYVTWKQSEIGTITFVMSILKK